MEHYGNGAPSLWTACRWELFLSVIFRECLVFLIDGVDQHDIDKQYVLFKVMQTCRLFRTLLSKTRTIPKMGPTTHRDARKIKPERRRSKALGD
jgi:hypothetical protein